MIEAALCVYERIKRERKYGLTWHRNNALRRSGMMLLTRVTIPLIPIILSMSTGSRSLICLRFRGLRLNGRTCGAPGSTSGIRLEMNLNVVNLSLASKPPMQWRPLVTTPQHCSDAFEQIVVRLQGQIEQNNHLLRVPDKLMIQGSVVLEQVTAVQI